MPDLDARVQSLRREGVKLRGAIVAGSGGRKIIVEDPDGNPIELFEMASSNVVAPMISLES